MSILGEKTDRALKKQVMEKLKTLREVIAESSKENRDSNIPKIKLRRINKENK